MKISIFSRCSSDNQGYNDVDLVDILRSLSTHDRTSVLGRTWRVSDIECNFFSQYSNSTDDMATMFPEYASQGRGDIVTVRGERLLERAAVVNQFESGLFLRVANPDHPIQLLESYVLSHGPDAFQANNIDLEIRIGEANAFEVVSDDIRVITSLRTQFRGTF